MGKWFYLAGLCKGNFDKIYGKKPADRWRDPRPLTVGCGIHSGRESRTGEHAHVGKSVAWSGTREHVYVIGVEGA